MIGKVNIRPVTKNDYYFYYYARKETVKEYIEKTHGWDTKVQKENHRKYFNFNMQNKHIIELECKKIGLLNYVEEIDCIEVDQIFILPKYQNKGIGSTILTEIINTGKNKKKPIIPGVLKSNIKAQKFYKKLGFIEYDQTDTEIKYRFE
jgi:ribosomal protein S18 acetylase RimI-like enzyme